jgi:hypothetical protein
MIRAIAAPSGLMLQERSVTTQISWPRLTNSSVLKPSAVLLPESVALFMPMKEKRCLASMT